MLTCKEATRLVSAARDRELALTERLGLGLHLLICSICRRYARQLAFISTLLRSDSGQAAGDAGAVLDGAARERIRSRLDSA